ncbi:hypothetical protein BDN72DRAFT_849650 [Pluteus cervinus]|uniref:Uncharacterized protein n=1 Tax=Pluteus cervinus TaxID=181527 RepID=A0ACD3A737_9AGAR|nr:hypothetical protein BDN72DRAFT_849650 [Pluteus cervinus]
MTRTSLPKGRECLRDGRKEERSLLGISFGRARFKYAGGGVWSYFGAQWQTMINAQQRHRRLVFPLKIIITRETGPWPRLAGIGEGGWPERVLPAVGLSAYKTRVAAFPLQVRMRIALQGEARLTIHYLVAGVLYRTTQLQDKTRLGLCPHIIFVNILILSSFRFGWGVL